MKKSSTENAGICGQKRTNPAKSGETRKRPDPQPPEPPDPDVSNLNFNQHRALVALLEAPSIAAAARQARVHERTIRRWLHDDPDFQRELRQMRQQYLAHAATRLQSTATEAVQALLDLLASKDHIEPGRAALVRIALDFAFRAGAYTDLAERLDDLEAAAAQDVSDRQPQRPRVTRDLDDEPADEAA